VKVKIHGRSEDTIAGGVGEKLEDFQASPVSFSNKGSKYESEDFGMVISSGLRKRPSGF
jgi:hypothetical protein